MEQDLQIKLDAQEKRLDDIFASVEKTRKYFMWTLIITVVTILLPLIAIALILPWLMKTLTSAYGI